jgi:HSP20 family protein
MTTALMPTAARPAQALSGLFDQVFGPIYSPFFSGGTSAQGVLANVYDFGEHYQAAVLIPGIDPQGLQVTALGNTITVAGTRQVGMPEGAKTVWQEFGEAQFSRQIALPLEVDPAKIAATYTNGTLWVTAPKAEHAKPRQIQVKM